MSKIKMTRDMFLKDLTTLLQETYEVTLEMVTKEYEVVKTGQQPLGIIGMFIVDNLKKVEIID